MTANGIMMKPGNKYDLCLVSGGIHVRLDDVLVEVVEQKSQPEPMLVHGLQRDGRIAMFPMSAVAWCRERTAFMSAECVSIAEAEARAYMDSVHGRAYS